MGKLLVGHSTASPNGSNALESANHTGEVTVGPLPDILTDSIKPIGRVAGFSSKELTDGFKINKLLSTVCKLFPTE